MMLMLYPSLLYGYAVGYWTISAGENVCNLVTLCGFICPYSVIIIAMFKFYN